MKLQFLSVLSIAMVDSLWLTILDALSHIFQGLSNFFFKRGYSENELKLCMYLT
jgi:hypothetical protein